MMIQRAAVSCSGVYWAAAIQSNRGVFHDKKKAQGVCLHVIGFPSICSVCRFIEQNV